MNRRQAMLTLGVGGSALLVSCSSISLSDTSSVANLESDQPQVSCPGTILLRVKSNPEYEKTHGSITKVEFYRGTTLLGTVTQSPWELSIALTKTNLPNYIDDSNGEDEGKLYKAKVWFKDGTVKTTNKLQVKVSSSCTTGDTSPPTIGLAVSSTTVSVAGSVDLLATANDNVGVTKVEFYEGSKLLSSKTAAPFSLTIPYTSANNGTHSYSAKAYDAAGNSTSSNTVSVVVNIGGSTGDTQPPTISLAASAASITANGSVNLMPTANDNTGVTKVEFYEGTTLLATKTATPFTHTIAYTSANNGTHSYSAKAYDAANNSATSNTVNVVVNIATTPPPTGQKVAMLTDFPTVGSFKRLSNVIIGGQPWNIILIRTAGGQPACGGASSSGVNLVAYSANCTHKGTLVQDPGVGGTKPGSIFCDNHGAEFDPANCAAILVYPNNNPVNNIPPLPSFVLSIAADGSVYLPK